VRRRRPGAAVAAAPAPKPSESAASTAEQPAQTQPPAETNGTPTPAPESQTSAQLPTPAATQDVAPQTVQPTEHAITENVPAVSESASAVVEDAPSTPKPSAKPVASESGKSPETVSVETPAEQARATPVEEREPRRPTEQPSPRPDEELRDTHENRHTTPSELVTNTQELPVTDTVPAQAQSAITSAPEQPSADDGDRPTSAGPPAAPDPPVQTSERLEEPATTETQGPGSAPTQTPSSDVQTPAEPTRPSGRRLPWTAVNAQPNDGADAAPTAPASRAKPKRRKKPTTLRKTNEADEQEAEEGPATSTATAPQTTRKRRRKAITLREMDEEDEQEAEEQGQSSGRRTTTRARSRRTATESAGDEAERTGPPAKKTRKPRKDKGKKRAAPEGEESQDGEAAEGEAPRPKRRRKQSTAQAEGANEGEAGGEGEQQPKRKGRAPREPTPSDAENEVIDPSATLMNRIASRNIRTGKLSEREKLMREINWDEVKQARREKERHQTAREIREQLERLRQEEADEAERIAAEQPAGPRLRLDENNQIQMVANSGQTDAATARAQERMEVVEENDLTKHVVAHSFLRNNKRFPGEFLLPGQGKVWRADDTEDFYKAMAIFGTDFAMMESLFPGVGRRSIKKKFNREEKRDPQRVKEVLQRQSLNTDWAQFLQDSGRTDDDFVRAKTIKQEMRAEKREMRKLIKAAQREAAENRRQRKLAGMDTEEDAAAEKKLEEERVRIKATRKEENESRKVRRDLGEQDVSSDSGDSSEDEGATMGEENEQDEVAEEENEQDQSGIAADEDVEEEIEEAVEDDDEGVEETVEGGKEDVEGDVEETSLTDDEQDIMQAFEGETEE
jgi:transcription factor TFIIIB component B''